MTWLRKLWNLFWKTSEDNYNANTIRKDYPSCFFRGVKKDTDVDNEVYLKASAFLFGSEVRKEDGMRELSIVWNDCKEALASLLKQKNKRGTGSMFEAGYATIQLSRFTSTVINQMEDGLVSYERRPIEENKAMGIEGNPYHGNILLHSKASEQMKKNIQHTLATLATFTKRT